MFGQCEVVFDGYTTNSVKDHEHLRRSSKVKCKEVQFLDEMKVIHKCEDFLSNPKQNSADIKAGSTVNRRRARSYTGTIWCRHHNCELHCSGFIYQLIKKLSIFWIFQKAERGLVEVFLRWHRCSCSACSSHERKIECYLLHFHKVKDVLECEGFIDMPPTTAQKCTSFPSLIQWLWYNLCHLWFW